MSDEKRYSDPAFFQLYEGYKSQTIFNSQYYRTPEGVIGIKPLENAVFHQWAVNVHPHSEDTDLYSIQNKVFDRLRHCEETIAGLYDTDNEEFNLIYKYFIREFFFADVWVGYSEQLKLREQAAWKIKGQERIDIEDCIFESNFRLYKRYKDGDAIRYKSLITNMSGFEIDLEETPLVKCSFNNGWNYIRLHEIFLRYESMLQAYNRLFFLACTKLELKVNNDAEVMNEIAQIYSPSVYLAPKGADATEKNKWNLFEACTIKEAQEAYDLLTTYYNDEMTRLGLAGDDSSKAERETTGENFRAMQPNSSFQSSMLRMLREVTYKIQKNLGAQVKFHLAIQSNEQGLPQIGEVKEQPQTRTDSNNDFE